MKDKQFLQWVHNRMVIHHGENPDYDYMHKLMAIITAVDEDVETVNMSSTIELTEQEIDSGFKVIRCLCCGAVNKTNEIGKFCQYGIGTSYGCPSCSVIPKEADKQDTGDIDFKIVKDIKTRIIHVEYDNSEQENRGIMIDKLDFLYGKENVLIKQSGPKPYPYVGVDEGLIIAHVKCGGDK